MPALWRLYREPVAGVTPQWEAGLAVTVGEEYEHLGITYRVVQSHTTQVGWEPPNVPTLWAVVT